MLTANDALEIVADKGYLSGAKNMVGPELCLVGFLPDEGITPSAFIG
jgi:hypothetical protein